MAADSKEHSIISRADELFRYIDNDQLEEFETDVAALKALADSRKVPFLDERFNAPEGFVYPKISLLSYASARGKKRFVECLITMGADKDANTPVTALFIAVEKKQYDIVTCLINNNVKVNKKTKSGTPPLVMAAQHGDVQLVELLLEAGADVNAIAKDGATPLYVAASYGHVATVIKLLEQNPELDVTMIDNGLCALHKAAAKGNEEIVRLLLEKGMPVDIKTVASDSSSSTLVPNITPLHLAANENNASVVKLLLSADADIEALTTFSRTPLWIAVLTGSLEAASVLLKAGAWVDAPTKHGTTPLALAVALDNNDMANLLLAHGATVTDNMLKKAKYFSPIRKTLKAALEGAQVKLSKQTKNTITQKDADIFFAYIDNTEEKPLTSFEKLLSGLKALERYDDKVFNLDLAFNAPTGFRLSSTSLLAYAAAKANKPIIGLLFNFGASVNQKTIGLAANEEIRELLSDELIRQVKKRQAIEYAQQIKHELISELKDYLGFLNRWWCHHRTRAENLLAPLTHIQIMSLEDLYNTLTCAVDDFNTQIKLENFSDNDVYYGKIVQYHSQIIKQMDSLGLGLALLARHRPVKTNTVIDEKPQREPTSAEIASASSSTSNAPIFAANSDNPVHYCTYPQGYYPVPAIDVNENQAIFNEAQETKPLHGAGSVENTNHVDSASSEPSAQASASNVVILNPARVPVAMFPCVSKTPLPTVQLKNATTFSQVEQTRSEGQAANAI